MGADDGWAWSFGDLPRYRDGGTEIAYAISEDAVAGYETTVDGYDIVNVHDPSLIDVAVSKDWDDADDQDGFRPEDITVELWADGVKTGQTLTLDETCGWEGAFTDLDEYAGGRRITYTVSEVDVADYSCAISGDFVNGYTIANTHTPETVDVFGYKGWADDDDRDGLRPEDVTIDLLANGDTVKSMTTSAADGWAFSFDDLPKYA